MDPGLDEDQKEWMPGWCQDLLAGLPDLVGHYGSNDWIWVWYWVNRLWQCQSVLIGMLAGGRFSSICIFCCSVFTVDWKYSNDFFRVCKRVMALSLKWQRCCR